MLRSVVDREEYTPRDTLLSDRDTYVLNLTATVDNNSYLCSSAFPLELPDYNAVIEKIKKLKSEKSYLNQIESLVRELTLKKNEKKKVFSQINGRYVIPGSSLKGAIRSRIEYKFVPRDGKIKSCYIIEGDFFVSEAVNHRKFWGDDVVNRRGSCNAERDNNVCIVCDMFGAPSLASLVSISDAYLENGGSEKLNLGIEVIKPGSRFTTTIVCRNFDYTRLGLLFLGLELYSKSPILLGMYKYRFNPKIRKPLFNGRYAFGLLRFDLKSAYSLKQPNINIEDLLARSRDALKERLDQYIDWDKGVM